MIMFEQDRSVSKWINMINPDFCFPYATVNNIFGFICKDDVKVNEFLVRSYKKEAGVQKCSINIDNFKLLERHLISLLGIKPVNPLDTFTVFDKKTFYAEGKFFVVEYKSDENGFFTPKGEGYRTVLFGTFDGMSDYAVQYAKEIALNQEWKVVDNL